MKFSLLILLVSLIGLTISGQKSKEDLEAIKTEGKGLLYSDPNKAYFLFSELEIKSHQYENEQIITHKEFLEFQGDANSGKGNYHLIANGNIDSAFHFYNISIINYRKADDLKGIGSIYNNKGLVLEQLNFQDSALQSYDSALYYYNLLDDKKSCAKTYGNIGNIYIDKGNFPLAQSYFLKCYETALELQDTLELAYSYFGLGNVANFTKNYTESEGYYRQALAAFENTEDLYGLSSAYFSIANAYKHQMKIDSAFLMYHQTLATFKKIGFTSSLPQCHINLAVLYNEYYDSLFNFPNKFSGQGVDLVVKNLQKTGLDSAIYYGKEAVNISKSVSKYYTLVYGYISLGTTENLLKNHTRSLAYADSAYSYIKDGNYMNELKQISLLKYKSYKELNNPEKALTWYEIYVSQKDSLYNIDQAEDLITQKYQFEYEMKTAQDSVKQAEELKLKNTEIELEKAENAQRKTQVLYLIIIAFVLLVMGIIVFQRLKITQKQKQIIDDQKKEVESQKSQIEIQHLELEESHKEISDSIRYAQRLQHAILPELTDLNEALKDGFVLFKPKDVVSGDFYWMQPTSNGILFAAADCTGHGVPGAMVSVVCSNALNRAVKEFGLIEPSDILNKTRELVIETFDSSSADVKDGMDIALCRINYTDKGADLSFAGANNPLWILRKDGLDIEEIKGDKQPIGKYETQSSFNQHEVNLTKGDRIYIFSDGYADQFGGEKGKKMKLKPFKDVLVNQINLPMNDQREKLYDIFTSWRGDFEQVDDVTVIGVRIT